MVITYKNYKVKVKRDEFFISFVKKITFILILLNGGDIKGIVYEVHPVSAYSLFASWIPSGSDGSGPRYCLVDLRRLSCYKNGICRPLHEWVSMVRFRINISLPQPHRIHFSLEEPLIRPFYLFQMGVPLLETSPLGSTFPFSLIHGKRGHPSQVMTCTCHRS